MRHWNMHFSPLLPVCAWSSTPSCLDDDSYVIHPPTLVREPYPLRDLSCYIRRVAWGVLAWSCCVLLYERRRYMCDLKLYGTTLTLMQAVLPATVYNLMPSRTNTSLFIMMLLWEFLPSKRFNSQRRNASGFRPNFAPRGLHPRGVRGGGREARCRAPGPENTPAKPSESRLTTTNFSRVSEISAQFWSEHMFRILACLRSASIVNRLVHGTIIIDRVSQKAIQ